MVELQELLSETEDPYFELKNGDLRAVERLFRHKGVLAQFRFFLAESDMDDGQLLAKYDLCATSGSKLMTRTVNRLEMTSKTGKVALVGFLINKLINKACL